MDAELKYLVALFEDKDEVVTEAVNKRILDMGPEVLGSIKYLARKEQDLEKRNIIKSRHEFFRAVFRLSDIEAFAHSGQEEQMNLYEGLKLIAAMINPNFSERKFEWDYNEVVHWIMYDINDTKRRNKKNTAWENVTLFNYNFFKDCRFTACDIMMTDDKAGLLDYVINTAHRKGNPITIATLYLAIANEVGLDFKLMCFPGGFIPAYVEDGKILFYVNIFNDGEILHENQLMDFMRSQGMELAREDAPTLRDITKIYTIYLESMLYIYTNLGIRSRSCMIDRALESFGPERFLCIDEDEDEM